MFQKNILLKYIFATTFFLSILGVSTHKIPALIDLHLNIVPLQIFYALFLLSFPLLLISLYFETNYKMSSQKIDASWEEKTIITLKKLFIYTLPTEVILIIINTITNSFRTHILHWIFTTFINLWFLSLAFYILYLYIKKYKATHKSQNISPSNHQSLNLKPKLFTILILSSVVTAHFLFGLYHLNKSTYVDERLWTYGNSKRIEKYWTNIFEKDWYNTRPSDKPGISLAFISGPSLFFTIPSDFRKENSPSLSNLMQMLFIMRLPVLIFTSLSLLLFYYLLKNLFNAKIGLLSTIFIGLSPILLGASRFINPDSLSWSIIPLTILSYFNFHKTKKLKWLYLSGILLGWGLLTKYISNILFVFFLLFIFTQNLFRKEENSEELKQDIRESLSSLAIITLISLIIFYIFFPGVWVRPERLLIGTLWSQPFEPIWQYFTIFISLLTLDYFFNKSSLTTLIIAKIQKLKYIIIIAIPIVFTITILITLYNVYLAHAPINFESIISSPKTSIRDGSFILYFKAFITSFYVLIFGISPLALIGTLLASLASWKMAYLKKTTSILLYIWYLFLFIIIFYTASIFSITVPIVRYQIILYPLILIIASYGWYYLFLEFKIKNKFIFYILILFVGLFSLSTLYSIRPYYFSYNNPLLPQKHLINLKDMGDGIYETVQYLNNLPGAENLNIWSDRNMVCRLFVGKCTNATSLKSFIKNGPIYDYYVASRGRKHRTTRLINQQLAVDSQYPLKLDKLYSTNPPTEFEVHLGNRTEQYIKIIKSNNIIILK